MATTSGVGLGSGSAFAVVVSAFDVLDNCGVGLSSAAGVGDGELVTSGVVLGSGVGLTSVLGEGLGDTSGVGVATGRASGRSFSSFTVRVSINAGCFTAGGSDKDEAGTFDGSNCVSGVFASTGVSDFASCLLEFVVSAAVAEFTSVADAGVGVGCATSMFGVAVTTGNAEGNPAFSLFDATSEFGNGLGPIFASRPSVLPFSFLYSASTAV